MLLLANIPYLKIAPWLLVATAMSWLIFKTWLYLRQKNEKQNRLTELVNQILPQTQCGKCGYVGCRPYAFAITQGEAINKCPPGGEATINWLADLLNQSPEPLNLEHGNVKPYETAIIREAECIGCTKCIDVCPVDAIIGGPKLMHTVVQQECTGCELCMEPCPVDCIDMISLVSYYAVGRLSSTDLLNQRRRGEYRRQRYEYHNYRLHKAPDKSLGQGGSLQVKNEQQEPNAIQSFSRVKARKEIAAAVARVQARKRQPAGNSRHTLENE